MTSVHRSLSYGPGDEAYADKSRFPPRLKSRKSSIFAASLMSFIKQPEAPPAPGTPDAVEQEELSKKQEDAWMQACYNGVALVFIVITGCICIAVYYVLERFLHPLLWAVLIGMFLHPFKHNSTMKIKEWLESLETSSVPLSVGIIISPIFVFNELAEFAEYRIMYYWKSRLYMVIAMASVWIAYSLNLPLHIYSGATVLSTTFQTVDAIVSRTAILQVCVHVCVGSNPSVDVFSI